MMRSETVQMDDEILIVDDEHETACHVREGWKVLIVDDEPEVHRITKMTLAQFIFDARPIEFLHAYTGDEAIAIMARFFLACVFPLAVNLAIEPVCEDLDDCPPVLE